MYSFIFKSIARGFGFAAAAIGLIVIAGRLSGIQSLTGILPHMPVMAISAATCFVLSGTALIIAVDGSEKRFHKHIFKALCAAIIIVGLFALSEYDLNSDFVIPGLVLGIPPYSAASFTLIGLSLLLLSSRDGIYSQFLAISTIVITSLTLIAYAYGVEDLYDVTYQHGITLPGSIALFLLGAGLLFARPDTGLMRMISSERIDGFLVRRLLPVAILLPIILGWLRLKGERAGLYSTEFGLLLFASSNIIILVAVIIRYTRFLERSDIERFRMEEDLHKVNRALKTRSKCNMALVKAISEKELLDSICATIVETGGYSMAWVGYAGKAEGEVEPQACTALRDSVQNRGGLHWVDDGCNKGPAEAALRRGEPVICKDKFCEKCFSSWHEMAVKRGFHSSIALPLVSDGKTLGALSIYTSEPEAFDKNELGLLMELANDLSFGIITLRTQAEHKRVDEENRLLKSIALSIAGAEDMHSAIDIVLSRVCEFTRWTLGEAWMPNHDGTALRCARIWTCGAGRESLEEGNERASFGSGEVLANRVWKLQEPEWLNDLVADNNASIRINNAFTVTLRAALAVPIVAGGSVLAVLVFYRCEPCAKEEPSVKVIAAVAAQLGSVLQRKLMEDELKESERKYRLLVESIPQRIFLKDRNSVYVSCNGNYASDLKILPEEIIGKSDYDFYPARLAEKYRADDKYIMESGIVLDIEEEYIKDEQEYFVHTVKTPVKDRQGNPTGVLGLFWDITESRRAAEERKKLEAQIRQMQKMEAVGQLTSGIAHDFNNMLAAIMISGSLLEKKVSDPKLKLLVQQILSASDKATNLTKGLLAFSRKQTIDIRPVSLNNLISNIEMLLTRIIGEEIKFKVDLPEENLSILADAGQIEQVLINLATNARDAMPEGGLLYVSSRSVDLDSSFAEAHALDAPGPYIMITVTDTGIGMNSSTAERIYEPFFTTKEVGKGTGLGLSIIYGIIKQHNGFINVYSEPGKGTAFNIYLPAARTKSETAESVQALPPPRGTETILLAEDNSEVRDLTRTFLKIAGYTVIEARDGEEAFQKFAENQEAISLLILDVVMPKRSGKDVYSAALRQKPGIKAIFTSGYNEDVIHRKGIIDHDLNFISKPYVPTDFLRKIREVLES